MSIFILPFLVPIFSLGDVETQDSIFRINFLECIKVVKCAVKITLECAL